MIKRVNRHGRYVDMDVSKIIDLRPQTRGNGMEITLDKVEVNHERGTSSVIGWVLVDLAGKMKIWMTVFDGKHGTYIKFPSARIAGQYVNALEWVGKDMAKEISAALLSQVKTHFPRLPQ